MRKVCVNGKHNVNDDNVCVFVCVYGCIHTNMCVRIHTFPHISIHMMIYGDDDKDDDNNICVFTCVYTSK